MKRFLLFCGWVSLLAVLATAASAQKNAASDEGVVLKGKVEFDPSMSQSWDGQKLEIPFPEITTQLFEQVDLPPIPFPEGWPNMTPEEQQKWALEFEETEAGKQFLDNRDQLLDEAHSFEVKIEKEGRFVVYDVPPGIYGLRGRVDKELEGTNYAFEVFGQIEVLEEMDEVQLAPIQIAITPLLTAGATAPPIAVETHNGKTKLTLDIFKDNYLFVSFWITNSPSAEYQNGIQKMYTELKGKHPLKLLSICVDEDRKSALKFIIEKQFKEGSHGFTDGLDHRTLFDYGVRTIPSFWLIGPDGKISMTQYDFARSFRLEPDLSVIVSNRIEGKDLPTPAVPPTEAGESTDVPESP